MMNAEISTGRRISVRRGSQAVNDRFGRDESLATQEKPRYHDPMPVVTPKTALRGFDINFFDVVHAGETYRVQIKRGATARRYTLRVRAATRDVVLTLPPRGSLTRAKVFVERHADWVKS